MEVLRKMSQTFLLTFKNFQNFLRREISKREKCRKRLQTSISRERERVYVPLDMGLEMTDMQLFYI